MSPPGCASVRESPPTGRYACSGYARARERRSSTGLCKHRLRSRDGEHRPGDGACDRGSHTRVLAPQEIVLVRASSVFRRGWPPRPDRTFLQPLFGTEMGTTAIRGSIAAINRVQQGHWTYFLKAPIFLKDGSAAITMTTIPPEWQNRSGDHLGDQALLPPQCGSQVVQPPRPRGRLGGPVASTLGAKSLCLPVTFSNRTETTRLVLGIGREW